MAKKIEAEKIEAKETEAYVDTSAFIAFMDSSDSYHPLFYRLFAAPPQLITSSLVIAEGHGWFLKRYNNTRALQFMSFIESLGDLRIAEVGEPEITCANKILRRFTDQKLTLTDALGLYMLETRKTMSCWSTDFHMGLTGVPLVIHQH